METISDMLSAAQLELVTKRLKVTGDTVLKPVGKIGNSHFYEEVGAPYRWCIEIKNHEVVGIHREKSTVPA